MPVTALLATLALDALDIPFYLDGTRIDLSSISLQVAEAGNGLRFLTGLVAMTIAFAWVTQRTLPQGLIMAGAAIPVAILANAIRVAAVVAAVHYVGPGAASGTIHNCIGKGVWGLTLGVLGVLLRRGTSQGLGCPVTPSTGDLVSETTPGGSKATCPTLGLPGVSVPRGTGEDSGSGCSERPRAAGERGLP